MPKMNDAEREQLIKAPEVYVVSMHGGIRKVCTFLL